jgi:hypothetical protein
MSDGWIKIHRKFLDWEWYDKSEMVHLFLHLLLNASVSNKRWHNTPVNRGQLITGRKKLSEETGISQQTVRTCLQRLVETGEIEITPTNKFSIITICNYDSYQDNVGGDNQDTTNGEPTSNPETKPKKTKEEIKAETEKRMKEFYKSLVPYVQTYGKEMVRAFYDYWSETNKSGSKMKWEQEPTWVLEKRLQRWANNDKSYKGKSNDNVNSRTSTTAAERAQGAASVIASLAAEE